LSPVSELVLLTRVKIGLTVVRHSDPRGPYVVGAITGAIRYVAIRFLLYDRLLPCLIGYVHG